MADKTPAQLEAEKKQAEAAAKQHAEDQRRKDEAERASNKQAGDRKTGGATVGGAMTTYGSAPAVTEPPEPVALTRDEIHGLAGDIQPGELAHIKLDEEGNPTGSILRGIVSGDDITAPVYGNPMVQFDDMVTPSGAPITKHMNPEPKLWDEGMLARNPPQEPDERQKKFQPRTGAPVVNQPVTV